MSKKPKQNKNSNQLLDALNFCKIITKPEGTINETHLLLNNNWAIAFNGVLACGHKITEDIICAPNASLITSAISKCNETFSITQLENKLSIKSGSFKCFVPTIDPILLGPTYPDPSVAVMTNAFKEAVEAVSVLATEGGQSIITASVLMAGASVIATDRHVMMEFWHGIDLPYGIALPKSFCVALEKIKKNLVGFGFSKSSATFYFEDESWIRSQFFAEPWPDVRAILDVKCNPWPLPNNFYKGIEAIESFADDGIVFFDKEIMRTSDSDSTGASYECFGIPQGPIFSIKQLKLIQPYVKEIDFQAGDKAIWYGDRCRGAIAGRIK